MAATELDFNPEFLHAMTVLDAGGNVFITGKAGTGKSTLLRHFLQTTAKRVAVAAPTGIAALNVGGLTIHRLFDFLPTVTVEYVQSKDYFPRRYVEVIRKLEVLVIDEVSMVRADLFDCLAVALSRFGPHRGEPFGGVQLVLVGDPYQLPPVVTEAEEAHFHTRYATPYFFSADAFRGFPNEIVQLDRVYRQRDDRFISLLNEIRTGTAGPDVLDALNDRCEPKFETPDDEFWVTLTTINARADQVNNQRLAKIEAPLITQYAASRGDLDGFYPPTPESLNYKVGAQVMLVANDIANRWVNGTLGVVVSSESADSGPRVRVALENGRMVDVSRYTWEVTRPLVAEGRLTYETVGTYTQLPFKLAWAVTIHKSQGKTLDRVVVDLYRGAFAEGQLYVALSRCTSFDGLVLRNQVKIRDVRVEREVTRFLARSAGTATAADTHAFIGVLSTGFGQYDRIFELGVVIEQAGVQVAEFSTLINPNRDVGEAATVHGVSASQLSLAPSLAEAWPWLARQLNGCVLVCSAMPLVATMIERELKKAGWAVSLGLGVDVQEKAREQGSGPVVASGSAIDRARAVRDVFKGLDASGLVTAAYAPGQEADGPGAAWSRTAIELRPDPCPGARAYGDFVEVAIAQGGDSDVWRPWLAGLRDIHQVGPDEAAAIHQDAVARLVQRAQRDGSVSEVERGRLAVVATLFDLPCPDFAEPADECSIADVLVVGARVCFTGSARDASGTMFERDDMKVMAVDLGLVPVDSVTKSRCEALIAADTSSMSGKAKKAREIGKPVFGIPEFLEWAKASLPG